MDYKLLLPLLVATVVTLPGWLAWHQLNVERERRAKKRELRSSYLLEAYRALAIGLPWRTTDTKYAIAFDQALADVQLLGSKRQVSLLHIVLDSIESTQSGDLEPLLDALRSELRSLMQMEDIDQKLRWHATTISDRHRKK
jgi:hypothetical protein